MKKILFVFFALVMAATTFAQNPVLRQRMEITQIEENGNFNLEIFQMDDNGRYYLSLGHLGIGDDIVQIQFDPVFELFIPLGETLDEAIDTMETILDLYSDLPLGESTETRGCLSAAYPNDQFETVTVTRRNSLFSRLLEFSVMRDDFVRATYVSKSNFKSLVTGLKFYKKLHPNEE